MPKTDAKLVERCIKKDPLAWAELVGKYSGLITISIENRLKNFGLPCVRADVEEIRQDILLSLWKGDKLTEIRNRSDISYWLAIVSGNAAVDYMRKKISREPVRPISIFDKLGEDTGEILETIPSPGPDPRKRASDREALETLKAAMGVLNDKEKVVVRLRFFLNKAEADIARMLGLSRGAVSSVISRARKKLRDRVGEKIE
jgi:RNA polymerase sigma factor (sigma-70 family)